MKINIDINKQIKWYIIYILMANLHPNASIEDIIAYTNRSLNK